MESSTKDNKNIFFVFGYYEHTRKGDGNGDQKKESSQKNRKAQSSQKSCKAPQTYSC